MICENCGAKVKKGERYCPRCGMELLVSNKPLKRKYLKGDQMDGYDHKAPQRPSKTDMKNPSLIRKIHGMKVPDTEIRDIKSMEIKDTVNTNLGNTVSMEIVDTTSTKIMDIKIPGTKAPDTPSTKMSTMRNLTTMKLSQRNQGYGVPLFFYLS